MRHRFLALLLVSAFFPQSSGAQAIFDAQAVRGLSAGMGSGMAASLGNGKVVQRSYDKMVQAQQAGLALSKAINDYAGFGIGYEKKKDWLQADKCFRYVLQLIARRDGPGSQSSVPVLKHLVHVNKEQKKLDDAISFQKTVLAFAKSAKQPDNKAILQAQRDLSGIYIEKQDYVSAEPVLKTSVSLAEGADFVAAEEKVAIKKQYAGVLRKLNREKEADSYEAVQAPLENRVAAIKSSPPAVPVVAAPVPVPAPSPAPVVDAPAPLPSPAAIEAGVPAVPSDAGTAPAASPVTSAAEPAAAPEATPAAPTGAASDAPPATETAPADTPVKNDPAPSGDSTLK